MKSLYHFPIIILLISTSILCKTSKAQNFHLVKDINTATDANPWNYNNNFLSSAAVNEYQRLNGIIYFGADDGIHGRGLWRSDGTEAGTYEVKEGVDPRNIVASNGKLFFVGVGNAGLWTSDGTGAGTMPVLSQVPPGMSGFIPTALTDFNGTLFFVISQQASNNQLWKTDGTANGTVLVKDYYSPDPQQSMSGLTNLTALKNRLYFTAYSSYPSFANVLCTSNGTADGTYVISSNIKDPRQLMSRTSNIADSLVYFTASALNSSNRALYVSNGNPGNAALVSGFNGFTASNSYVKHLVNKQGVFYFVGRLDASSPVESLYKFDINSGKGIEPVKIVSGSNGTDKFSSVYNIAAIDSTLYFGVYDATTDRNQVWKSDGSSNGNMLLKDSLSGSRFLKGNSVIYFSGNEGSTGNELWKTDGTAAGTSIVNDINHKTNRSSYPDFLTVSNDKLFFAANDGEHGNELWQSDGTGAGTILLKDINQTATGSSLISPSTSFDNKLIFSVSGNGSQVFISDGTRGGTNVVNDTVYGFVPYAKGNSVLNHFFYFFGNLPFLQNGLYKTNGTSSGTILVKNFLYNPQIYAKIEATDSLVYFFIQNKNRVWELWRSDGTEANTYIIKNGFDANSGSPSDFVSIGKDLYFVSPNGGLWKTNGTATGTILLKSFANAYNPSNLKVHNGKLFFTAFDGFFSGLWKSDGTPDGTIRVTDKVSYPGNFTSSGGQLFFIATEIGSDYGDVGRELFKTDGTDKGTVLVKDMEPGFNSSNISLPVTLTDTLYFFRTHINNNDISLWKSDGTADGTKAVANIGNVLPSRVIECNRKLFFPVGNTLWESDGTQAGTHAVTDEIFSTVTINPYNDITAVGNQLFFTGSNYKYGQELYAGYISKPGVVNYYSAANGAWSNPSTWVGNVVPPTGAVVVIKHNVTGNVNATCSELRVEEAGTLTMNEGVKIAMLQ